MRTTSGSTEWILIFDIAIEAIALVEPIGPTRRSFIRRRRVFCIGLIAESISRQVLLGSEVRRNAPTNF